MRTTILTFSGTCADFLDYLDDLALDASIARHPAGKGLGRGN